MLSLGTKVTVILASMHWTLLEFSRPWLVTSDHPVVMWPLSERARTPQPTSMDAGVLETLEVRVPVSPHQAILMTWKDEPARRSHAGRLRSSPGARHPAVPRIRPRDG